MLLSFTRSPLLTGGLIAASLFISSEALADPIRSRHGHHGHHGGHHNSHRHNHRSGVTFHFSNAYPFYGSYHRPYYYRSPIAYYPAPVVNQTLVYDTPFTPYNNTVEDVADDDGRYCREFQKEIVVGNKIKNGYGRACMQPDGSWEVVS